MDSGGQMPGPCQMMFSSLISPSRLLLRQVFQFSLSIFILSVTLYSTLSLSSPICNASRPVLHVGVVPWVFGFPRGVSTTPLVPSSHWSQLPRITICFTRTLPGGAWQMALPQYGWSSGQFGIAPPKLFRQPGS